MMPWWSIILIVGAIVIIFLIVRGVAVARRCRNILKKGGDEILEPEVVDEDSESGSADNG